ncbi:hypothetical protein CN481_20210 [Bacillus sp. AFS006103]|nr:hypothetical protein CN481_20210 [Bacillus sp. AFS006103]
MDNIGIFRLPNNYSHSLKITGFNQKGTLYFSVDIFEGKIKTAGIETVNWQDLKDFLKKNEFQRYEAHIINPKYFNLMEQLRKELFEVHPKKINSQKRILILTKRLFIHREALDLSELAKEFNVSHSQLVRDISIIRSIFDYKEIRYNRISHKYELI